VGHLATNTVESALSLLKRDIVAHGIFCEAPSCLFAIDDVAVQLTKEPYLFRDSMLKLISASNVEYKELTKAA